MYWTNWILTLWPFWCKVMVLQLIMRVYMNVPNYMKIQEFETFHSKPTNVRHEWNYLKYGDYEWTRTMNACIKICANPSSRWQYFTGQLKILTWMWCRIKKVSSSANSIWLIFYGYIIIMSILMEMHQIVVQIFHSETKCWTKNDPDMNFIKT